MGFRATVFVAVSDASCHYVGRQDVVVDVRARGGERANEILFLCVIQVCNFKNKKIHKKEKKNKKRREPWTKQKETMIR